MMTADVAEAARSLRAVLAAVDAGELSAGPDQRVWLRGAVDALEAVADGGSGGCGPGPDTGGVGPRPSN